MGQDPMPDADTVRLMVPATPELLRLARVTAAGLASRMGFSFDEVEDLRLAMDELCFGLTGPRSRPGTVRVVFTSSDAGLRISGIGEFATPAEPVRLSKLSDTILSSLVDSHELYPDASRPAFTMTKLRTAAQPAR